MYRDMTRMKIYQRVEFLEKKAAKLKKELEQETNERKCYELNYSKQVQKVDELKNKLLDATKDRCKIVGNANRDLQKIKQQSKMLEESQKQV